LTEEKAYAIAQQVISTVNALSIAELDAMAAKIQAEPGTVQEAANLFVEHLRNSAV